MEPRVGIDLRHRSSMLTVEVGKAAREGYVWSPSWLLHHR